MNDPWSFRRARICAMKAIPTFVAFDAFRTQLVFESR